MRFSKSVVLIAASLFLAGSVARAEVKVVTERNQGDQATSEFKFKQVPSPAKTSAATKATFSIIDGEKDGASAELDALHDGKLPSEEDEPDSNFFFNADTDGGSIVIDLGSVIDIKQINTYSWHPNTRGPQIYTLYAADGSAPGFTASPKKDVDPTTVGWKLITKVDTKPKGDEIGGQYGVSISDTNGSLGKFRYLLMVITKTEGDDGFGNTFYSEICVIDNNEKPAAPAVPAVPAAPLVPAQPKTLIALPAKPE
jgi:hypothetical protein